VTRTLGGREGTRKARQRPKGRINSKRPRKNGQASGQCLRRPAPSGARYDKTRPGLKRHGDVGRGPRSQRPPREPSKAPLRPLCSSGDLFGTPHDWGPARLRRARGYLDGSSTGLAGPERTEGRLLLRRTLDIRFGSFSRPRAPRGGLKGDGFAGGNVDADVRRHAHCSRELGRN